MVVLLHVGRLTLAISRFVSRNQIVCKAAVSSYPIHAADWYYTRDGSCIQ